MPLSYQHVLHVCKLNCGKEECRYLNEDELTRNNFQCMKLSPQKESIDESVEYAKNNKEQKKKYETYGFGDNCKGYPVLRHKIVGYDQKQP